MAPFPPTLGAILSHGLYLKVTLKSVPVLPQNPFSGQSIYGEISDAASVPPKTDPSAGLALWEALSEIACATRVRVGLPARDGHMPVPECHSAGQAFLQEW